MSIDNHKLMSSGRLFNMTIRRIASMLTQENIRKETDWQPKWPPNVHVKIGSLLLSKLIEVAKIYPKDTSSENAT